MGSSVTVITGAAGALGGAVARELVSRGHRVIAVDREAAAQSLAKLAADLGSSCTLLALDVGSVEGWQKRLPDAVRALGEPNGAVLVAGAWAGGTPVHATRDDTAWKSMLTINADTVYASLRALLPGMVERRQGSVVVIGSRAVERPWTSAGAAAYAASKSAVVALAQSVAAEVLEHGVRINAVLPSTIDTPANRAAMPTVDPNQWVSAGSLAAVIAFLLSDAARDVSGAALPVYGRA